MPVSFFLDYLILLLYTEIETDVGEVYFPLLVGCEVKMKIHVD